MDSRIDISYPGDLWYLVHCKPRQEGYAANILRTTLKLTVFLPENRIRLRGKIQQRPFFPGYIFAQANLQRTPRSCINTSPGVVRLVDFGGEPQPVPRYVIEEISAQLDNLNTPGHAFHHGFCPGDSIRMKQGSLQDLEMIFVGPATPSKRVCVLLSFLGRLKEVYVDAGNLEKLPGKSVIQSTMEINRSPVL